MTNDIYRAFLESSIDVVTVVDATGLVVYQSPSLEAIFGYHPEDLLGQNVMEYVHPDDQERVGTALGRILEVPKVVERLELRFLHKNGSWRHIEAVGSHFEDEGLSGAVINSRDITDRQILLSQLRESSALFETVFSVARNILTITEPETGRFIDVNDQWCLTMGYVREEVIGRTANELKVWGDGASRSKLLADLNETGHLENYRGSLYTKSGERREIVMDASFIQVLGESRLLLSATDVTEMTVMEEQLRQSQKMEALGQLTGGVAHDFNNLLGVVSGNAELIQMMNDDSQIEELVQAILQATERGAALTHQLLAFARRQALHPRAIYPDKLITEQRPLLQRTLGASIIVAMESSRDLWSCFVDPGQLENAVLNIALNARDAMPSGGKLTVTVRNRRIDRSDDLTAGEYVEIAFSDTGSGMGQEVVSQVFEPFFTTKDVGKGTGLGLSMVFGFAKQSGGHVEIESEPGVGSTVRILLPRTDSESSERVDSQERLPEGRGESILLLEDNHELQKVTVRMLEQLGYAVSAAADETELRSRLSALASLDLLISDIMLPGDRQGPELAREVLQRFPGARLLFISGYAYGSGETPASLHDADLLSKPFSKMQLATAVRDALDHRHRG